MIFPLILGVGSAKSGIGKTTFIENFIRFVKKMNDQIFIISVKYSKTSRSVSIITDPQIIEESGKDTARMKKAGADYVYWIRAPEEQLEEVSNKLREEIQLSFFENYRNRMIVILEGNSLVRFMHADVIIFFTINREEQIKPSGKAILDLADIIIQKDYVMEDIMSEIEKIQQQKFIEKLLKERNHDGKITCSEARKIAEELRVPYIEVGRVANELKIKIKRCELGCF